MKLRCEKQRKNGTRCKNTAVEGATFCRYHLGYSDQSAACLPQKAQRDPSIEYDFLARLGYFVTGVGIAFFVFFVLQESANVDFLKKYGNYPILHFIFGIVGPLLFFLTRNSSQTQDVETLRQVHRSPILHVSQSKVYDVTQVDVGPQPYHMAGLAFVMALSYPLFIWMLVNNGTIYSRIGPASLIYLGVCGAAISVGKSSINSGRYSSASLGVILASFVFLVVACLR